MKVFQVVGQPGAGKTLLITDLVEALVERDIRVGTIKHTAHAYELDKPGKDSFLHRTSGAVPAAMMNQNMGAVYFPRHPDMTPATLLESSFYRDLDLVLIEGWISGPYGKIEVWRKETGRPPLFPTLDQVLALVTDDPLDAEIHAGLISAEVTPMPRSRIPDIIELLNACLS